MPRRAGAATGATETMTPDDPGVGRLDPTALAEEVHVWWAATSALDDPALRQRCEGWLSASETERYRRYLRAEDRTLYLLAHALLRHTLARYADLAPAEWSFAATEHGRPEPSGRCADFGLRFNLTHTPGLAACVIGDRVDAGIDVERAGRIERPLDLAATSFAEGERRALGALPAAALNQRFLEIWTLREAWLKARGTGFTLPRDRFALTVEGGGIGLELSDPADGDPRDWQLQLWRPLEGYQGAVAVRRGPAADRRVVVRRGLAGGAPP